MAVVSSQPRGRRRLRRRLGTFLRPELHGPVHFSSTTTGRAEARDSSSRAKHSPAGEVRSNAVRCHSHPPRPHSRALRHLEHPLPPMLRLLAHMMRLMRASCAARPTSQVEPWRCRHRFRPPGALSGGQGGLCSARSGGWRGRADASKARACGRAGRVALRGRTCARAGARGSVSLRIGLSAIVMY